ncbi:MAG: UDP-N-acetylmuramoyl-L-alanyl-D-glutamate--2,6-diaminopimelate ligase, partial [Candidatus Terrybacteria bacterium CG10_big_fil_rev_8_21_14_0_10_41_10]
KKKGSELTFKGEKISTHLSGGFNLYNILAASFFGLSQNIGVETIKKAVEEFKGTPGRMEEVDEGQDFTVIVDYAHTTDSLEKVYEVFQNSSKICVLGSTGGGRDKWKRPELGRIADNYCNHIILTNEDPYDEDPKKIVEDVAGGIKRPSYDIIMDRREAIRKALSQAKTGDTVIITGKGTDPYIMGPNGTKLEWSDSRITREELKKLNISPLGSKAPK